MEDHDFSRQWFATRGWHDTWAFFRKQRLLKAGGLLVWFALMTALSSRLDTWMSDYMPTWLSAYFDSGLAEATVGIAGVAAVFLTVFLYQTVRAPFRQRDEALARAALSGSNSAQPDRVDDAIRTLQETVDIAGKRVSMADVLLAMESHLIGVFDLSELGLEILNVWRIDSRESVPGNPLGMSVATALRRVGIIEKPSVHDLDEPSAMDKLYSVHNPSPRGFTTLSDFGTEVISRLKNPAVETGDAATKQARRADSITRWRKGAAYFGRKDSSKRGSVAAQSWYREMRPHMTEETISWFERGIRVGPAVSIGHRKTDLDRIHDEIAMIEKEWGLL